MYRECRLQHPRECSNLVLKVVKNLVEEGDHEVESWVGGPRHHDSADFQGLEDLGNLTYVLVISQTTS